MNARRTDPNPVRTGQRQRWERSSATKLAILGATAAALTLALSGCLRQPPPLLGNLIVVVQHQDGGPAAGAEVTLVRTDLAASAGSQAHRNATTNADGQARLDRVLEGVYALTATLEPSFAAFSSDVTIVRDQEASVSITLDQAGSLEGAAFLSDRPEAGGVRVELLATPLFTLSEEDGSYKLSGAPHGTFDVRFSAPGYAPMTVSDLQIGAGESVPLDHVTLQRLAPYARFLARVSGNEVTLDASESYDVSGRIVRYLWDFGDGTRAEGGVTAATYRHTYSVSGPKTITLTVVNDSGHLDSASLTVQVTLPVLQVGGGPYSYTLPPGTDGHFDVRVPAAAHGAVLYIEVQAAQSIQVRQGAHAYYSAAPSSFRRLQAGQALEAGAEPGPVVDPLAISVGRICLGPCVLLPTSGGGATLTVHNPSSSARPITVHLSAEPFADLNEPNDVCASATPLGPGTDSGAMELALDIDWFKLTASGRLTFDAPAAIGLRAELLDANCVNPRPLASGVPTSVVSGQLIRLRALNDQAGPAGTSAYHLTLD